MAMEVKVAKLKVSRITEETKKVHWRRPKKGPWCPFLPDQVAGMPPIKKEAVEVEVVEVRVVIQGGILPSSSVPVEVAAACAVLGNLLRQEAQIVKVEVKVKDEAVEVRVTRGSLPPLPKKQQSRKPWKVEQ
mmetsp:Transcript_23324/g.41783  ORF Transcript_23324/g.41783 Transcript_23324/m.41783 type:complete len:132 (-) Transcript_23324:254-649(-)